MPRRALVFALTALASVLPGSAAQISERTTYFAIHGSTLEDIDAELQRRGPVVGAAGLRHPGATTVEFEGHVTYERDASRCRVGETHLALHLEMTLPKWRSADQASPGIALIWRTLSEDIARHEREHADIARHWVRRMESALRNLAPQRNCTAMEERVTATTRRYLRDHERAQRDFDRVEGREVNRRLRRAFRANVEAEIARKAQEAQVIKR